MDEPRQDMPEVVKSEFICDRGMFRSALQELAGEVVIKWKGRSQMFRVKKVTPSTIFPERDLAEMQREMANMIAKQISTGNLSAICPVCHQVIP